MLIDPLSAHTPPSPLNGVRGAAAARHPPRSEEGHDQPRDRLVLHPPTPARLLARDLSKWVTLRALVLHPDQESEKELSVAANKTSLSQNVGSRGGVLV